MERQRMKVVPRERHVALRPSLTAARMKSIFIGHSYNKRKKEKTHMAQLAQCPECEAELNLQGLLVGEILYCPDCNAELEVLNVEQPEVALAPQVEEDWGE